MENPILNNKLLLQDLQSGVSEPEDLPPVEGKPLVHRRIPPNRRNKFTTRFIPQVRAVGNLDNLSITTIDGDDQLVTERTPEPTTTAARVEETTRKRRPTIIRRRPTGLRRKRPFLRPVQPVKQDVDDVEAMGEEMIKSLLQQAEPEKTIFGRIAA